MSMLSMSISLTRCYQKLSPWLCTPLDQTSRAYLETHLDLLTDEYEQFLAIFVSQHENSPVDQQLLRTLQHLLRESRERGGTQQAVRDAYINVFGGLILDLPAWLARVEQQLEVVFSLAQTDRLVAENKMRLKEAISQAVREHLAPEIVAELQYQWEDYSQTEYSNVQQVRSKPPLAATKPHYASILQSATHCNTQKSWQRLTMSIVDLPDLKLSAMQVNHLRLEAGGLHLDSTATLHTVGGVQLWLRGPMHQGTLTRCPSWSSLARPEAFSRSRFSPQSDRHAGCICILGSGTQRATPCAGDLSAVCPQTGHAFEV